jgi:hypothetical protein
VITRTGNPGRICQLRLDIEVTSKDLLAGRVLVPLLFITHGLMFRLLLRGDAVAASRESQLRG